MDAQAMQMIDRPPPADDETRVREERTSYRFGGFTARPACRDLSCGGRPVDVGSRAFDLLVILLRSQGEIVSKDDIFRHVWPSTTVDESNLRFQMATLRKALGSERDRIKTIPGRGYLFVADPADDEIPANNAPASREEWPSIVIIDRDPENRAALQRLLRPFQAFVQSFGSMEAFLQSNALTAE